MSDTKKVAEGQATEEKKVTVDETANSKADTTENKTEEKTEENISADVNSMSDDQIKFARINIRKEFNKKYSKWAEIDPVDADDDFIAQAKKDVEDATEENKNAMFELATPDDGLNLKTAEFLQNWNKKYNHWEKGQWRGVISFERVIKKIIDDLKADSTKSFEVDYQTLLFLYSTMMNPFGTGLESAIAMAEMENYDIENDGVREEDIPVTYSGILEKVNIHLNGISANYKKLNILKQRLELAYGGLKMNLKISSVEEFVEFSNKITSDGVADSTDEVSAGK
jgi:hypothetical protein